MRTSEPPLAKSDPTVTTLFFHFSFHPTFPPFSPIPPLPKLFLCA